MSGLPEGAQEAVEELAAAISVPIDEWLDGTGKSESFKQGAIICALTKVLVIWSMLYEVPAEVVIKSVISCLHANGALGDDDEVVH